MAYRVLARAYRSSTFDEVVGQGAIATTLKNAIESGRVHHGYLFTGTRGVGKTSMARILAKALNCLTSDQATTTPCCDCDSCRAVSEGEDVDVVEIDAASNTGVDNIRELRNNAAFRPTRSRYKIYIIDEVHMLSTGAFNALLKTLEEPPEHVKFVLATTDPEKVPATIKSRCQQFDFKAIDANSISDHLRAILDTEKIQAEDGVLRRIARLANGSMRDALSLLDKVLSFESVNLTSDVVDEIIPPPHDELAAHVMARIATGDAAGALQAFDVALQGGRTVDRFCDSLINHARTLMLLRVCGAQTELVDVAAQLREELSQQASAFDAPTFVYMVSMLEELRRNVRYSGASRALADAAIVRLAMCHQFSDIKELVARIETDGEDAVRAKKKVTPKLAAPTKQKPTPHPTATPIRHSKAINAKNESDTEVLPLAASAPNLSAEASSDEPAIKAPAQISAAQWAQVAKDPLVVRVTEQVEGTLFDVRPMDDQDQVHTPTKINTGE